MQVSPLRNRKPAVAGTFYPTGYNKLTDTLQNLFSEASSSLHFENIKALITPHAGYVYSGAVAASAFNQLDPEQVYENVFLIGSSHHDSFDGAAIFTEGDFETPLGIAKVNQQLALEILNSNRDIFINDPKVHAGEHSLEVQLPFLQYIYKDHLQIIPIIIATESISTIKKIADTISPYFNANNLFVVSTDFSHYPDYESANTIDRITGNAILSNSSETFLAVLDKNSQKEISNLVTSICGWTSVLTLLYITEDSACIKYHGLVYRNSGDTDIGNKHRVVGYHAMALTADIADKTEYLDDEEKKSLLNIARSTIREYLETGKTKDAGTTSYLPDKFLQPAGAFVTLKKNKKLRGCIGQFNADRPLYKVIQEMSVSAATRDYRFNSISADELNKIKIEISVLTPMRLIKSIDEIIPGKHGIYIRKGINSGTYLPQVARQTNWTVVELLSHCARDKAGIGWDGWKDAEIYVYEAYIFTD